MVHYEARDSRQEYAYAMSTQKEQGRSCRVHQLKAMSFLNAILFRRQLSMNLCCILVCPVGLMSVVGLLCLTLANTLRGAIPSATLFCSNTPSLTPNGLPRNFDTIRSPPSLTELNHAGFYTNSPTRSFARRFPCQHLFASTSMLSSPPYTNAGSPGPVGMGTTFTPGPTGGWSPTGKDSLGDSIYAPPSRDPHTVPWYILTGPGINASSPTATGPTGRIPQRGLPGGANGGHATAPWFTTIEATPDGKPSTSISAKMAIYLVNFISYLNANPQVDLQSPLPPHGTIEIKVWDGPGQHIQYTLQMGSSRRLAADPRVFRLYPTQGMRQLIAHTQLTASLLSERYGQQIQAAPGIRAFPQRINPVENNDVTAYVGAYFYPFAISFLLPLFVHALVRDKEEMLYNMMRMGGLHPGCYWIAQYITFSLSQFVSSLVFLAAGAIFQVSLVTRTSPIVYLVLFAVWTHTQVSMAVFISLFFQKSRRAMLYTTAFVVFSISMHFAVGPVFRTGGGPPWVWYLHPCWAFYQALAHVVIHASMLDGKEPLIARDLVSGYLGICLLILLIETSLMLFISWGVGRGWTISRLLRTTRKKPFSLAIVRRHMDDDVRAEEERISKDDGFLLAASPLVVSSLRHVYPSTGVAALDGLSFAVEPQTVFGLLGPNGAGKSTLIHLLTGILPISEGDAFVSECSIRGVSGSQMSIGICPQHDIHWGELTVEEHMLFYAKLQGLSSTVDTTPKIEQALDMMNLQHVRHSLAEVLSGGEKRRLSIGIAIIGWKAVVFLDEPTTGLDPEARRLIWRIIHGLRKRTTIVLTTHSMEEAESLCSRIAIVNQGRIKCIGSPVHLRKKFSQGFRLTLTCAKGRKKGVIRFLKAILPSHARLVDDISRSLVYEFDVKDSGSQGEAVRVGKIMSLIEDEGSRLAGIVEWGISQTSLEDVFLHIVDTSTLHDLSEEDSTA